MGAPTIRWDESRGLRGQWDLRGLGPEELRCLREQITLLLRGDIREGGPSCTCIDIQDAHLDRHFEGCARRPEGT